MDLVRPIDLLRRTVDETGVDARYLRIQRVAPERWQRFIPSFEDEDAKPGLAPVGAELADILAITNPYAIDIAFSTATIQYPERVVGKTLQTAAAYSQEFVEIVDGHLKLALEHPYLGQEPPEPVKIEVKLRGIIANNAQIKETSGGIMVSPWVGDQRYRTRRGTSQMFTNWLDKAAKSGWLVGIDCVEIWYEIPLYSVHDQIRLQAYLEGEAKSDLAETLKG